MVTSCCVYNCNNQQGDNSKFRHFLRFHRFPKEKKLQKAWIDRTRRRTEDINPNTMFLCSDHLHDKDFSESEFLKSKLMYSKSCKIPLKKTAIPNTDPDTGAYSSPIPTTSPAASVRSHKRRRDVNYIDQLIDENTNVISSTSSAPDPEEMPTPQSAIEPVPEIPTQDVVEFLAEEFKQRVHLPDCTISNTDFQTKILIYLSCDVCCPTRVETLHKILEFPPDIQQFIAEVIREIDSLIAAFTNKQEPDDTPECPTQDNEFVKKLEESFSNGQSTPQSTPIEEKWKTKYTILHKQHIANETEIQDLVERLDQSYHDTALLKEEIKNLQSQVSDRNSLLVQLEDTKISNRELADELERANRSSDKLRNKLETMKKIEEIEEKLREREDENKQLQRDLATANLLNNQNQQARQDYRKEAQERRRLQVENNALQKLIEQLRNEKEEVRRAQRQPVSSATLNTSVDIAPVCSLADELQACSGDSDEVTSLKEQLAEISDYAKVKLENETYRIDEKILQEQIANQIEQINKECNRVFEFELKLKHKTEELESLKDKYDRVKSESEARLEDLTHKYRQDVAKTKASLNEALFISRKDVLDKDTTIKQLESRLNSLKSTITLSTPVSKVATTTNTAVPSPSTPVYLRKFRTPRKDRWNTPSAIPRLITPVKRLTAQEFDDKRMAEISKRNQAAPPHLRSTYPIEAQYHTKSVELDSTGRITTDYIADKTLQSTQKPVAFEISAKKSTASEVPFSKCTSSEIPVPKATAFEIPQNTPPRNRKKRDIARTKSARNNVKSLLQFSPPKSKRRK